MSLTIAGVFVVDGQGQDGATVDAWSITRTWPGGLPPAYNAAAPSGSPDIAAVTTDVSFGSPGAFELTAAGEGDYYVRVQYAGNTYWQGPFTAAEGLALPAGDLGGSLADPTVVSTHLTSPLPTAQGGTGNTSGQPSGTAGGDLTGTFPSPTLAAVGSAGTTGDATHVAQITTDTKGRVTGATAVAIALSASQVTNAADKSSSSTQTFAAEVLAPSLAANLSGTAGRFVGWLTAAPGSGTYATNDWGVGVASGKVVVVVCTAGGTPGTWTVGTVTNSPVTSVTANDGTLVATPSGSTVDLKRAAITGDVTVAGGSNSASVTAVQGVTQTSATATLMAQANGGTSRSASATVAAGETTVFTGSTASQTLTLPVGPQASTVNTVTNAASVAVTLAAGSGNSLSSFGTVGSVTIPAGATLRVIFVGTTWYVIGTNLTAPTAPALSADALIANSQYVDAAVGVETTRAETAEDALQLEAVFVLDAGLTSWPTVGGGYFYTFDTTSGSISGSLPSAPADKTRVGFKMVAQGGTNTVTINCAGSDTFNKAGGGTSYVLSLLNQGVIMQYNASGGGFWVITADDLPLGDLDARYQQGPLSGDATTPSTTSGAVTLATVNSSPGTVGDAGHVVQVVVNGKGLVTSATAVPITPGAIGAVPTPTGMSFVSTTTYTVASVTLNGTTTATVASGGFPNVIVGQTVTGTDIAAGTTVAAVSGNTLTLSLAATGSTTTTLTFGQLASATSPSNTRRCTLSFGTGSGGLPGSSGWQDICHRGYFTLPVTPTRCRLRIRNYDTASSTAESQNVVITGLYWGTPNTNEQNWAGDFIAAPTAILSSLFPTTQNLGTEDWVTPWFTPPAAATAYAPQALSIGYTIATDEHVNVEGTPGLCWATTTGAGGPSTMVGNEAAPSAGTAYYNTTPFDVRLEYEYVGDNPIVLCIGDSLTSGNVLAGFGGVQPSASMGHEGPDDSWPSVMGLAAGACVINLGAATANTTLFTTNPSVAAAASPPWSWRRCDLGPLALAGYSSVAGVSCTPDVAIICLGFNDCINTPLASLIESNLTTIIQNCQAIGINKIIVATLPPSIPTGGVQGGSCGALLKATLSAGAMGSSINAIGPCTSTTAQPGPSGPPGGPTNWYQSAATTTVSSCTTTNTSKTVTVSSGGFPSVVQGMMVRGTGITDGTQVQSISGNTLTLTQNATASGTVTLTFSYCAVWFEVPESGLAEGPFPVTAASGTTTLAMTPQGTTVNAHQAGCVLFTLAEGCRQTVNNWIRNGPPGAVAMLDFAREAEQGQLPSQYSVGNPQVPMTGQHWYYYSASGSYVHPASPALYKRWGQMAAAGARV